MSYPVVSIPRVVHVYNLVVLKLGRPTGEPARLPRNRTDVEQIGTMDFQRETKYSITGQRR